MKSNHSDNNYSISGHREETFSDKKNKTVLLDSFGAWQGSHTPLDDNPNIPSPIADRIRKTWNKKVIKMIGDLFVNVIFSSFLQLSELFNLSKHNLFKYLQIRHCKAVIGIIS